MDQESTTAEIKGCTCSDWITNSPHQSHLSRSGDGAIRKIELTPFRYCPWCGQELGEGLGQRDEALLDSSNRQIEESFFAGDEWGMPQIPNMLVAAHPISMYRQTTGDILGTLELMLTFMESGTRFTNRYGDIDEPFYEGLELMLSEFRTLLLEHPDLYERAGLALRLQRLLREAGDLAWGYGDFVREQVGLIQQHFGEE